MLDSQKEAHRFQSYMTNIYVPIFLSPLTGGERVEQQKVTLFPGGHSMPSVTLLAWARMAR